MTTLRERVENDEYIPPEIIRFFKTNRRNTPLCCFDSKKLPNGEWRIRCNWIKKWMSYDGFRIVCLECQEEIEKKLNKK